MTPPALLVARREVEERLRSKAYYVLTGVLVALILAVGVIARVADDGDATEHVDIGIVGERASLVEQLEQTGANLDVEVRTSALPDGEAGESALRDGDLDALIVVDGAQLLFEDSVDDTTAALVGQAWWMSDVAERLTASGADPATIAVLTDPTAPTIRTLEDDEDEVDGVAVLAGTVTAILLFMCLQTFGGYVLMGVVEEKATAVVEVLLVRIKAQQLLIGKLLGIGAAALLQFTVAVLAGVAALAISGADVPTDVFRALPVSIIWFLGGYALYSTLFALAGCLVSRQEDAQAAAAPIMTVLVAAYLTIYLFGWTPTSTASRILSVIPPFAPFSMPLRMAAGAASVLEIVLALAFMALAVVGATRLTARIYAEMLLRHGTRVPWLQALRTARSS